MGEFDDLYEFSEATSPISNKTRRKQKNRINEGREERQCYMCNKWLSITEFSLTKKAMFITKPRVVYQAACKLCQCAYQKKRASR